MQGWAVPDECARVSNCRTPSVEHPVVGERDRTARADANPSLVKTDVRRPRQVPDSVSKRLLKSGETGNGPCRLVRSTAAPPQLNIADRRRTNSS